MATPESEQRGLVDSDNALSGPDRQLESDNMSSSQSNPPAQPGEKLSDLTLGGETGGEPDHDGSNDTERAQAVGDAHAMVSGSKCDEMDLDNQPEDRPLDEPDEEVSLAQQPSAVERSSPLPDYSAMSSTGSASFDTMSLGAAPSGFMFPRLDRRNLELGGKRKEAHRIVSSGSDLPLVDPSSQNKETPSETGTVPASSSPILTAIDGGTAHSASGHTVAYSSDDTPADGQVSSHSRDRIQATQNDHVQYQVDQQIIQEASTSDGPELELSSEPQSDGVVCVGTNLIKPCTSARAIAPREMIYDQISPPNVRPVLTSRQSAFADSVRDTTGKRASLRSREPVSDSRPRSNAVRQQHGSHASRGHPHPRDTAPVSAPSETQDLLDIVAYKFREKEQSLQRAFSADHKKMQSELHQAYDENETLRSQMRAFEEHLNQSERAISKYRSQISKAKGLQKFIDGLGNDLHSLKHSYEIEKINFTARIEASETEIERLECSLAGKDEFETMLSHSKVTLEKLLDAKGFELQCVIQHRDMLRGQLDERIGQLVEERDTRMRLEQLVGQLRLDGRMSLTASLEQVTTSLLSKMSDLGQQGGELAIDIAGIHHDVRDLTERRPATLNDCKAIKAEIHELGLSIAHGLSIEAATNTTVADLTTSVEGLIQHHMRTLRQELERMETSWKESASSKQAHVALQTQLQGANERLAQLECQLSAARESEVATNHSLDKSLARISELEAVALRSPTPSSGGVSSLTPQDVEQKVREAVAVAQKQLSDNANSFIAQEKARYSNELKKIGSERRKAIEKADAQTEELKELHSELGKLRNAKSTKTSETVQQLEDLSGRFQALERKYEAATIEAIEKGKLESKLTTAIAELDAAKLRMTEYEKEAVDIVQEIKDCKTALLQSRAAEKNLQSQLEEMQSKTDACANDIRRQLSQAEGRARYAEAGLDQMRSSAQNTISEEQEKHRKQREALQKRLEEAQTELETNSKEADETQAFVERTVKHQQEAWEKLYADLEFKVSEHKLSLELTSKAFSDVQIERDNIQTKFAHLQAVLQQQQQGDAERQAREATNQGIIDDLRKKHDAARKEIANLQVAKNQLARFKDEYEARENIARDFINELRKERDSAKAQIATLQANERQRASDDVTRQARDNDLQRKMDDLQNERDTANAALKSLRAANDHSQNNNLVIVEPGDQRTTDTIVPPKVSEYPSPFEQRRKADRNTNTIVTGNLCSEPQPTDLLAARTPKPVTTPALIALAGTLIQDVLTQSDLHHTKASSSRQQSRLPSNSRSTDSDEMLDSTITRAVSTKAPETQYGSSMQTSSTLNEAGFPKTASHSSQAFAMPLDFSGKPMVSDGRPLADNPPSAMLSPVLHSPGFQIYEDSQNPVSDGQFEEDSVREDFTFRKPIPRSNSASKRKSRKPPGESLEGRVAPSRGTQRPSDNTSHLDFSQSNNTPKASNYPFGSSPEFMNPPSIKVKRQYSGPHSKPGSQPSTRQPSSPIPDPRIMARSGAAKRRASKDSQQTEEPPTKKRAMPAATKVVKNRMSDESLPARSSQSVNDLPRVEDMNAGRTAGKSQSSHMRSSGTSTRTTRNQAKMSKDDAYKARFSQELKNP